MKPRELFSFLVLLALVTLGHPAHSQEAHPSSLPTGNALADGETLETIVRNVVAQVIDAEVVGTGIHIRTSAIQETISLPKLPELTQAILSALGIQNELSIGLSPIVTNITLPRDQLKVTVTNKDRNRFKVKAKWSLSKFSTYIDQLSISTPPGFFERPVFIDSKPVTAGLKTGSIPIEFEIDFEIELTLTGAKISLGELKTNLLAEKQPEFNLSLGPLTVEGKPLELEIISNGQSLLASEVQIRKEIQALEPYILKSLRKSIVNYINGEIKKVSEKMKETPPFQYSVNTSTLLEPVDLSKDLKDLFGAININFIFSHLQKIKSLNLFSGQVSTEICFEDQCILNANLGNPIDSSDVKQVTPDGGSGILIYESFLKTAIESEVFQRRIRTYFQKTNSLAGVNLGPSGVKIGLVPDLNSIAVVLNLEINIKKTVNSGTRLGKRLKTKFGGLIEQIFGAGKIIKIPVEILFHLDGIKVDPNGSRFIVSTPSFPFPADGGFSYPIICSLKYCPSNLEDMTRMVKGSFLSTIKDEIVSLVPPTIEIPLNKPFTIQGLQYTPQGIMVTPHHALLMTSKIIQTVKERQ